MTDVEMAKQWVTANTGFSPKQPLGKIAVRTFLAGLNAGRVDEQLTKTMKELKDEYNKLLINYNTLLKEYDELEDEAGELRECY